MSENRWSLEQERINELYYPTHLLGFEFDGRPLCLARGHVTTTMSQSEVTCEDCKEALKKLMPPKENERRIKMTVEVDLDPLPGSFHTKESAFQIMSNLIRNLAPHYNPSVTLED